MSDLLKRQVDDYKRKLLVDALKECGGNIAAVARKFGRHKSSVFNTLRFLGINAADYRPKSYKDAV